MILLDANVVIDLFDKQSEFHGWAKQVIVDAVTGPGGLINPIALAESLHQVSDAKRAIQELQSLGLQIVDLPHGTAELAAAAYGLYLAKRKASGSPPPASKVPLPDFFIGAHAEHGNYTLATRDAARFQTYFPQVKLRTPSPADRRRSRFGGGV
jgi:predicted nucleic acid-binding protein